MFKSILSEIVPKILQKNAIKSNVNNQIRSFLNASFLKHHTPACIAQQERCFSSTTSKFNLMEFFDHEKNWGESLVKHGREWKLEELRLKSSVDLHKLWFILLKERNMLLTMAEAYKNEYESLPNPERIAKVDLSMENILTVVRERDVSYNLLEKGVSKEKTPYHKFNSFGLLQLYEPSEHYLPWYLNKSWKLRYHYKRLPLWSKWFRNQLALKEKKKRNKTLKRIQEKIEKLSIKHPELTTENKDYWEEYFKTKENILIEPESYSSKLNKPRPDELPAFLSKNKRENPKLDDEV